MSMKPDFFDISAGHVDPASMSPGRVATGADRRLIDAAPTDPVVGRVVRFVLPAGSRRAGDVRPAIVVRILRAIADPDSPGMANLHVFLDGPNDAGDHPWFGSVLHSDAREPGTWHWPERA